MLIGSDYPKIEFSFFGLELLEPNAMIGDTALCCFSLFFAFLIRRHPLQTPFFVAWRWFFVFFGVSFFFGGLGHLFFNYLGVSGKFFSWYLGIFAVFLVEIAMGSLLKVGRLRRAFFFFVYFKLLVVFVGESVVFLFVDITKDPSFGLLLPTINSSLGLFLSLGLLGFFYYKTLCSGFFFFFVSVFVLAPASVLQIKKISLHPWFDRNDASHALLLFCLFLYFLGIRAYQKHLS